MKRYFLFFSYDGTAYHGWQLQPNAVSVQQRLNEALRTLLRRPIDTVGAGRTDTGVHARMMAAHFDAEPLNPAWLTDKLNRILPPDIAVHAVREMRDGAHARFDATARTYHYHVYTGKCPFRRHYAARLFFRPDFEQMNRAAQELLAVRDFTSFSKLHTDARTNLCRLDRAEWVCLAPDYWRFEITADRFLRNMVRAVVGTLLDVGRGKMPPEGVEAIVANNPDNVVVVDEACVAFDRIAYDAVVTQGVSPAGEQTVESAEGAVESCIADALGREGTCEVEVSARDVGRVGGGEATFSVAPTLTTYECTLTFRPWGSGFSVAGTSFSPPVELTHVRELTVDRFRPGVVV